MIVSGGDRILSDIEKLWIFTIVKMRFGMFDIKRQPKVDQCSLGADSVPGGCVLLVEIRDPTITNTTGQHYGSP